MVVVSAAAYTAIALRPLRLSGAGPQGVSMSRPPDPASPLPHDAAYKAMYRHPQAIWDLCHYLVAPLGPLGPETLAALHLSTVEKLPAEWVTVDFRRRHGDQVWRIRFREAAPDAGADAWLLLLLEFQSRDDTDMALRILGYVVELYRDLEAQGVVRSGTRRPPVLPVVVHNGESPWSAPVEVAELIGLPQVPAQVRRNLRALQPSQRLHVVDFARHRQDDLVPGNVVSLQMGFEHSAPSDYARLLPAVAELADAGLRRTVWEWVALRARRDGLVLEEVDMEGTYFRSRIGENMRRATRAWFEEGRAEGIREGRAEGVEAGIEQQRILLGRLIARKFGANASARVVALLAQIAGPELLAEIGEGLLVCATETELVARVEAVIESKAPPPGH